MGSMIESIINKKKIARLNPCHDWGVAKVRKAVFCNQNPQSKPTVAAIICF